MTKLKLIGWIASFLSLFGTVLNAFQIIWCWPLWLLGNFIWIYWSWTKKEWSQLLLWISFQITNIIGWINWIK